MKRAALSIEGSKISIAIASGTPWRMTVYKRMTVDLPDADKERTEALNSIFQNLNHEHGVKGVIIGLEPGNFTHTFVDLPVLGRVDVEQALSFELEKYLPLPPDEYVLDFHTERNESGGSHNLIVSARKDKLSWITRAIEGTGVLVLGLRCTAFEVLNDLIATRGASSCLYVYQGAASAAAITLSNSEPVSLSFRPLGADAEATVREMIEGHEENVIVTGVESAATYTGERISTLKITPTDSLLTARRGRKKPFALDFTPPELVQEKANHLPLAITVLAGLCVLVFFMTSVLSYYKDYSALARVQGRLSEIRSSSEGLVEIKLETEVLERQIRYLGDFRSGSNGHILLLNRLSRILPASAWLTSFTASNTGTVEIEGFARRTAEIIRPLEQSDEFMGVEFSSPITVRNDFERFSIKMKVAP